MSYAHLRSFLGRTAKMFLEKHARKKLSSYPEVMKLLMDFSPSTGCDYTDYWSLYRYIRKYQPREVLELGSGISTVLIAQALAENGVGRLTSMEESPQYYEATQKLIPESLRKYIDLRLSSAVEDHYGPFRGVRYERVPERLYDFVLVDGPQYDPDTSFDMDIIRILEKTEHPVTAFVDSRTGSCFIYNLLLGPKFKFSYLRRLGVITNATRHDLRGYRDVVAGAMKKRIFSRTW